MHRGWFVGLLTLVLGLGGLLAYPDPPGDSKKNGGVRVAAASGEAQKALDGYQIPAGYKGSVFAAEPMLANPIAFSIDQKGQAFVAESFRVHAGVTDIRGIMDWLDDDLACRTVADRLAMMRKRTGSRFSQYSGNPDRVRKIVDTDGDGKAEILTGTDVGAAPHVRLFRGDTGALMGGFFAYAQNFLGGVRVAIGDITGDGKGELLTGAGAGGAPHVMVRDASNFSILRSFFAGSPLDRSGVSLTAADLDGDGKAEIIAAAGRGPNSGRINIYRGTNNSLLRTTKIKDAAFGLFVGTQDVNADGTPEIFYSNGVGGSSRVGTLNSLTLKDIDAFYSNDPRFMGGTSIS